MTLYSNPFWRAVQETPELHVIIIQAKPLVSALKNLYFLYQSLGFLISECSLISMLVGWTLFMKIDKRVVSNKGHVGGKLCLK